MRDQIYIINGKLENDGYNEDFHMFRNGRVISLTIFLPGINPQSIIVQIKEYEISIEAFIIPEIRNVVLDTKIVIKGTLPYLVHPRTMNATYKNGIYFLELALISTESNQK
ncbi:MAG: hypothetical protein INQ03_01180 [Candidatus Heimdallarchaeota archaeon]|nr:hypothetical protein [Candidatus Heimdallarchaeota archaeon]